MSTKVFEGVVELKIQEFLTNLAKLEQESAQTAGKVTNSFKELDKTLTDVAAKFGLLNRAAQQDGQQQQQAVQQTVATHQQAFTTLMALAEKNRQELKSQSNSVSEYLEKTGAQYTKLAELAKNATMAELDRLNRLANKDQAKAEQEVTKAKQEAYDAQAKAAIKAADIEDMVAQKATKDQIYQARLQLEALKDVANEKALILKREETVLKQVQAAKQAILARDKQLWQEANKGLEDSLKEQTKAQEKAAAEQVKQNEELAKRLRAEDELAHRQRLANEKVWQDTKLRGFKAYSQGVEQAQQDHHSRVLSQARTQTSAEIAEVRKRYDQETAELRKQIDEQRRLQQQSLVEANDAKRVSEAARLDNRVGLAQSAEEGYQRSQFAAQRAADAEASLQRRLTNNLQAQRRLQEEAARKAYAEAEAAAKDAAAAEARAGAQGARAQFEQIREDGRAAFANYESLHRVGEQVQSVGRDLMGFAGAVAGTGVVLTKNAGDFDFWARRLMASMQAAGTGEGIANIESLRGNIIQLGQDLGTLKPDEVAQSWYLYQAAVGTQITTEKELQDAMSATNSILKAAVISDTSAEVAIRGVTQAMAEFGVAQEDAAHVTAVMMNLTQTSQAEFSDVLESYKMVGPLAHSLGMTIEETSAVMARLSDYGLRGSQAGRGLAQVFSSFLEPSDEAADILNEVLVTSQGLEGTWRDVIFPGEKFIGLVDEIGADGKVSEGAITKLAKSIFNLGDAQQKMVLSEIGSANATRTLLPLVEEKLRIMKQGEKAALGQKKSLEEMTAAFGDETLQAKSFGDQWAAIGESIKVKFGKSLYEIQAGLIQLGYIAADALLPVVDWIARAVEKVGEWAQQNEGAASTIVKIVAVLGTLAGILGPLLWAIGGVASGIGAIGAAWSAVGAPALAVVMTTFGGLSGTLLALTGVFGVVIGAVALLAYAWRNNFGGMGDDLADLWNKISYFFSVIGGIFSEGLGVIWALWTGNTIALKQHTDEIVIRLIEAFRYLLPNIAATLAEVGAEAYTVFGSWLGSLAEATFVWGANLVRSLAAGIWSQAQEAWDAAWDLAEGIAAYFRSYSPPRHGPLQGIYVWGKNLVKTLLEGMSSQELDAVDDIAKNIGDALLARHGRGQLSDADYVTGAKLANEKAAEMMRILREGREVGAEFFEGFRKFLGDSYDEVVRIATAYQNVLKSERLVKVEEEKLQRIREQRQELQAQKEVLDEQRAVLEEQKRLREDAFSGAASGSDADLYERNKDQLVDPTTAEGAALIAQKRQALSREEFNNWLAFQQRMWAVKDAAADKELRAKEEALDAQDRVLSAEEQAINKVIAVQQKQLELFQEQYNVAVKLVETMERLAAIEAPQEQESAADRAANEKRDQDRATSEQLNDAKKRVAEITGEDAVIADEGAVIAGAGGDYHAAVGAAAEQTKREEERLEKLKAEERKRKAKVQQDLINATTDDERTAIRNQDQADTAAARDEENRLRSRVEDAKEVEDATARERDRTSTERIAAERLKDEEEIHKVVGDTNGEIKDANELLQESADLREAEDKSQEQLRRATSQKNALQEAGNRKEQDFQERIERAKAEGNAAEVSRIEEEKKAWEQAYKSQMNLLDERERRAREVHQAHSDALNAEADDERRRAEAERKREDAERGVGGAGGGPGSKGDRSFPDRGVPGGRGGGGGAPDFKLPVSNRTGMGDADGDGLIDRYDNAPNGPETAPSTGTPDYINYGRGTYAPPKPQSRIAAEQDYRGGTGDRTKDDGARGASGRPNPFSGVGRTLRKIFMPEGQDKEQSLPSRFMEGFGESPIGRFLAGHGDDFRRGAGIFGGAVSGVFGAETPWARRGRAQAGLPHLSGPGGAVTGIPDVLRGIRDWLLGKPKDRGGEGDLIPGGKGLDGRVSPKAGVGAGATARPFVFDESWLEKAKRKLAEFGDGVAEKWAELKGRVSAKVAEIRESIAEKVEEWKTRISEKVSEIRGAIAEKVEEWKAHISEKVAQIRESLSAKWEEIRGNVHAKVEELRGNLTAKWEEIRGNLHAKVEELRGNLTSKWEEIRGNVHSKVEELRGNLTTKWEEIRGNVHSKVEELRGNLTAKWEEIRGNAHSKVEELRGNVQAKWEEVRSNVETKLTTIRDEIKTKWEEIKDKLWSKFDEIRDTIGAKWEEVKKKLWEKFDNVRDTIGSKWDEIKTKIWEKIGEWATNVGTKWQEVTDGIKGAITAGVSQLSEALFGSWFDPDTGLPATIRNGLLRMKNAAGSLVDAVVEGITGAASRVKEAILSWLPGYRKNDNGDKDDRDFWTNGSHATGLARVPFDGYVAELHEGETVLTKAEAEQYRKNKGFTSGGGLLDPLFQLQQAASGALFGANAATALHYVREVVNNNQVTNETSVTKQTTINIQNLDANSPDQAKTLLSQLSFYSN